MQKSTRALCQILEMDCHHQGKKWVKRGTTAVYTAPQFRRLANTSSWGVKGPYKQLLCNVEMI
eukprot:scaffold75244_cov20-Tisochrysis_lutea.AAC.6